MKFEANIVKADYFGGTHIVNALGPQRITLEHATARLYGNRAVHLGDLSDSDIRRVARADGALQRELMDHHGEWGLPPHPAPAVAWSDALMPDRIVGGRWLRCEADPDGVHVLRDNGEVGTLDDLGYPGARCSAMTLEFRGIHVVKGWNPHYRCIGPVITHVTVHPNPPMPRVERILAGWAVMGRRGSIANVDAVQFARDHLHHFTDRWLEGDVTSGIASEGPATTVELAVDYFTNGKTFVCAGGNAEEVRATCLPRLAHGVHFTHFRCAPQETDVAAAYHDGPLVVATDTPLGSRVFPIDSLQHVSPWMVERERELSKLEYVRFTQRWWTLPLHRHLKVNLTVPLLLLVDRRLRNTEPERQTLPTLPLPVWFAVFGFLRFELRVPPRLL